MQRADESLFAIACRLLRDDGSDPSSYLSAKDCQGKSLGAKLPDALTEILTNTVFWTVDPNARMTA